MTGRPEGIAALTAHLRSVGVNARVADSGSARWLSKRPARIVVKTLRAAHISGAIVCTVHPEAHVVVSQVIGERRWSVTFDPRSISRFAPLASLDTLDAPIDHVSVRRAVSIASPCHYCGKPSGSADHIVPVSIGGSDRWWNLIPSCRGCNSRKSNEAPSCDCVFCERSREMFIIGHRRDSVALRSPTMMG